MFKSTPWSREAVKFIPKYSNVNKNGGLVFMCCDLQTAFSQAMPNFASGVHVANRFLDAAPAMGAKYIVTEQYPKGLGHTTKDIRLKQAQEENKADVKVFDKTIFSMITPEVEAELPKISGKTEGPFPDHCIVLFGIEAHVCVMQTVEDLVARNYFVAVASDGTFSQAEESRQYALQRFQSFGPDKVMVGSSESILLRLVQDAKDPAMKTVMKLLKQQAPYRRLPSSL